VKGIGELFSCEHQLEVLWIDSGEAPIPLFGVDIPASSQGVGLCTKFTRSETNDQVKRGEVFQPSGLPTGENLRGGEVLQVFVVGHDVNWKGRALQVVMPALESLEDSEELLVVSIIVQLGCSQSAGVECNWSYLVV